MFYYVLPETVDLTTARPDRDFFRNMVDELIRWKHFPFGIVRLRDAVYCREKQFPLLIPQSQYAQLYMRKDYRKTMESYGETPELHTVLPPFQTYEAIQFKEGALLFSRTPKGESLLRSFRKWLLHHFFDSQIPDSIGRWHLPLFDHSLKNMVDRFPRMSDKEIQNVGMDDILSGKFLAPPNAVANGLFADAYDTPPTLDAVEALYEEFRRDECRLSFTGRSRYIAGLMNIQKNGLENFSKDEPFGTFGYTDDFMPLCRILYDETTTQHDAEDVQQEARTLAAALLERDFPHRRRMDSQEERTNRQSVQHVASIPYARLVKNKIP